MKTRTGIKITGALVLVGLALFGLSYIVMKLWNFALAPTFEINPITYWQAMGILILSKLLFGFPFRKGGGRWDRRRWSDKFKNMSEEERNEFRKKWQERCRMQKNDE